MRISALIGLRDDYRKVKYALFVQKVVGSELPLATIDLAWVIIGNLKFEPYFDVIYPL